MKSTKSKIRCGGMLTILVLALGLMVWPVGSTEAEPMSTAFTYQGRFVETNEPADGFGLTGPSVSIIVYLGGVDSRCKKVAV